MAGPGALQVGRISRFLTKLFGTKGQSPELFWSSDVAIVVPLFNGSENRALDSWDMFALSKDFGASAANLNLFRLRNPVGSNRIAVITRIVFSAGATDRAVVSNGPTGADLGTPITVNGIRWDPRGNNGSALSATFTQQAGGADLTNTIYQQQFLATTPTEVIWYEDQEFPLLPGEGIHMRNGIVNQSGDITVWWRERTLEDSEKT